MGSRCIMTLWSQTYLHESGRERAGTYGLGSLLHNSLMLRQLEYFVATYPVIMKIVDSGGSGDGISCLYQVPLIYTGQAIVWKRTGLIWRDRMVEPSNNDVVRPRLPERFESKVVSNFGWIR